MNRLNVIEKAFEGDEDILMLCDRDMQVTSTKELAAGIEKKLQEYEENYECHFVDIENKGYIFYIDQLLISFAINKSLRATDLLWQTIKQHLTGDFYCMLYNNNVRAIKWLIKKGMEIIKQDNSITILCQLQ